MTKIIKQGLPKMLSVWQETCNWQPDPGHLLEFQSLYELILQGNQELNLTRITEPKDFWEKHLWDSLRGVAPVLTVEGVTANGNNLENRLKDSVNFNVIDIGTGAGFPGLPVAIACPNWQVTLLDSTRKKIAFINTIIDKLGMENARTLISRAEEIGQNSQHREMYDLALTRAIGGASVCAEFALPLLKVGGLAILYRGHWSDEETEALSSTIQQLGGIIDFIERFKTPLTQSVRHCLYLRKVAPTDSQFPRAVGVPTQKPI